MPIRPENRDRYPKNWDAISKTVKVLAGWRCQCEGECGRGTHEGRCPNEHGKPAYGTGSNVVLTTAHLDHTPENCDPANLRAMCQGCHLHYDREHHAQTRAATRAATLATLMTPANHYPANGGITKVTPNDSPPVRPFADVLREINHGAVADLAASQLADLVQQVSHVGRPGTLTLTIKVAPFTGGGNTLQVSAATALKAPKHDPHAGVFFFSDSGALSRNDPNLTPLFTDKDAE